MTGLTNGTRRSAQAAFPDPLPVARGLVRWGDRGEVLLDLGEGAGCPWRESPLTYAGHCKAPFLLLQGLSEEGDWATSHEQMQVGPGTQDEPVQLMLF